MILADVVRSELSRRPTKVLRKAGDGSEISLLGTGGEVAQLHILAHALP